MWYMSVEGVVDVAVVVGNSIDDPIDVSKEFTVKTSEPPAPGFPWWILGLMAAGVVLAVVVSKT